MIKNKKRIAILCIIINIILLTQICFENVAALYDTVTTLVSDDESTESSYGFCELE
jgi:hypothetical protein